MIKCFKASNTATLSAEVSILVCMALSISANPVSKSVFIALSSSRSLITKSCILNLKKGELLGNKANNNFALKLFTPLAPMPW